MKYITSIYLSLSFCRRLKNYLTEDVVRTMHSEPATTQAIEEEFIQLKEDRDNLRQIFPAGESKVRFEYGHLISTEYHIFELSSLVGLLIIGSILTCKTTYFIYYSFCPTVFSETMHLYWSF